jgi:putative hemolysin
MGNELVNVAFAVTVASAVYDVAGPVQWKMSLLVSIAIATPAVLVFGEVVPKNVAIRYASSLVPVLVGPVRLFSKFVFPLRYLLTKFADKIVLLFGGDPGQVRSMIMEEEFRQLVDLGYKEGALEEGESELIHRIFELGNRKVADIMTPVGQMFRLSIDNHLDKIIREIRETQYNRVPVYHSDPADIIGILHSREVFRLYRDRQRGRMPALEEIVRPAHFVKEDEVIENVLSDFQKLKMHIAIVKNKENKISGMITMDDIFRLLFTQKLERKARNRG